jgi:hypothetical protein
VHVKV